MSNDLARLMVERISAGLSRKTVTSCSRWAMKYRVMGKPFPGPWSFKYHPWLRGMHDSEADFNVGRKCAQVGFTETALNDVFFHIDVKRVDCLYVLPAAAPDATDFSSGRFDPALELSPHLSRIFSDVKNVGHKRAGSVNLYIRGARSRSGLKSVPVGLVVLDEVDEMEQENVALAMERTAGQNERKIWAISTPSLPGHGIDLLFEDTTQEHFFFRCPACSRHTELIFPDSLVIPAEDRFDPKVKGSHLICKECKATLPHETKADWLANGIWVAGRTDRDKRGFYINQLYSSADVCRPEALAAYWLNAQGNPSAEREFWNSKMGLPFTPPDARLTDVQIDACIGSYASVTSYTGRNFVTMGVDVGSRWLHYEIDELLLTGAATTDINSQVRPRVLKVGKVKQFEELDKLLHDYQVNSCVVDSLPERRKALEFASRNYGRVRLCFYGQGIAGKLIHSSKDNEVEPLVTVDRTSWLDASLGRFRQGTISLPLDIGEEYKVHLKALVRKISTDKLGNPVGQFVKIDKDEDHFSHARNYSEIAIPFALSLAANHDIVG
jgi:hypothetical protein